MKWWRNYFGINERKQDFLQVKSHQKHEKYANGSGSESETIMVMRYMPAGERGSKGMECKYDNDLCAYETKETVMHVHLECTYATIR